MTKTVHFNLVNPWLIGRRSHETNMRKRSRTDRQTDRQTHSEEKAIWYLTRPLKNLKSVIFLLYPMRSMRESIGIGLETSSTSKGPQAKTAEPMDSIKVTYCSIQLGWILARGDFAKNYMGSRPEAKKFFSSTIFSTPLHRLKWNWKPTINLAKWNAD